ncbi:MAG: lytic transglycosylase domain-containing protein [Myxococcales bacterium]|nr:lytic transglycosylase domain-containing protein [Myxococcales bacterium]
MLALVPNVAAAWSDAPLCALREPYEAAMSQPASLLSIQEPIEPIPWTEPITLEDARGAYFEAEMLRDAQRPADALLHLRVVEEAMPSLSDRIALHKGDLLMDLGQAEPACSAYEQARDTPTGSILAAARVGLVHCALARDQRDAELQLQKLFQRYPRVSDRDELRLAQADSRARRGNRWGAAQLYRTIDLQNPGSREAQRARTALARLEQQGLSIRALTAIELVDRADRLVRSGPIDLAQATVDDLLNQKRLSAPLRARLHLLKARMARIAGRWEEAEHEVVSARKLGAPPGDSARYMPPPAPARDLADREAALKRARAQIFKIQRRRPMIRLSTMQLRTVLRIAVQNELRPVATEALEALNRRRSTRPIVRFEAALEALGTADDATVAKTLEKIIHIRRYRLAGRYHYARALERAGRADEAEPHYRAIIEADKTSTRYYAMWSEQRLWSIQSQAHQSCAPPLPMSGPAVKNISERALCIGGAGRLREPLQEQAASLAALDPNTREEVAQLLAPLVATHGNAFPWFQRALDLVHLGDFAAAADEIHEAYLAYRDSRGSPRLRIGLLSIFTGKAPPRRLPGPQTRRARRSLDMESRKTLAVIAERLGDAGTALRFGIWRPNDRPRAYPLEVQRAAAEHGVDPNLLYAVMRVESIYNPRIISHVGAIGLTQIMPRTGRLIADRLGVENFEVTDLLDPTTNLRFSAWYLASLIERFNGRLPLAIASYNGGPHNVRLWLRKRSLNMPLDAFLEHIPFSQTHRYVRRVLTHYAAYRAQQGLPMPRLHMDLPDTGPDEIAF